MVLIVVDTLRADVLEDLNSFVIKPAQGSGGKGILVIRGRKPLEFAMGADVRGIEAIGISTDCTLE